MSAKILIVYATNWGSTKKMAETISEGARSIESTEVMVKEAESAKKEDLIAADALILGSPVHMGSPDWRVKKFIDDECSKLWMEDKLIGKVGAVFSSGSGFGSAGGGCEITMLALMNNLAELGLVIIPLPKNTPGYALGGLQWGPYGRSMGIHMEQTGLDSEKIEAAFHHGKNIARATHLIKGKKIFGE